MTDPGTADRTYIGPMTPELVEQILDKVGANMRSLGVTSGIKSGPQRDLIAVEGSNGCA